MLSNRTQSLLTTSFGKTIPRKWNIAVSLYQLDIVFFAWKINESFNEPLIIFVIGDALVIRIIR